MCLPDAASSRETPIRRSSSRLRGHMMTARECTVLLGASSMMRTSMFWRSRSQAITSPTGPAPTTRTGLLGFSWLRSGVTVLPLHCLWFGSRRVRVPSLVPSRVGAASSGAARGAGRRRTTR